MSGDYGTGPKGDGLPCQRCGRRACDGYCEATEPVTTVYLRTVPTDVKRKFKAWCAEQGVSMTSKLVELMRGTYEVPGHSAGPRRARSAGAT